MNEDEEALANLVLEAQGVDLGQGADTMQAPIEASPRLEESSDSGSVHEKNLPAEPIYHVRDVWERIAQICDNSIPFLIASKSEEFLRARSRMGHATPLMQALLVYFYRAHHDEDRRPGELFKFFKNKLCFRPGVRGERNIHSQALEVYGQRMTEQCVDGFIFLFQDGSLGHITCYTNENDDGDYAMICALLRKTEGGTKCLTFEMLPQEFPEARDAYNEK